MNENKETVDINSPERLIINGIVDINMLTVDLRKSRMKLLKLHKMGTPEDFYQIHESLINAEILLLGASFKLSEILKKNRTGEPSET